MRTLAERPVIAVTSGEPAGIGPELCAALAGYRADVRIVVLGDIALIRSRVGRIDPSIRVLPYVSGSRQPDPDRDHLDAATGLLEVGSVPLCTPSVPGRLEVANAPYVLNMLDAAVDGCLAGAFSAMVTAPVHKAVINDAGIPFSGHTEYLAQRTHTDRVVMMLVGGGMRVALATTHLPLAAVPAALTTEMLETTLRILHGDLVSRFGLSQPRILVAGLNPHAGEGGHIGREEIEVIEPVLRRLRDQGMRLIGPLPADTLFVPHSLAQGDAVLAMYHDQGLPVLKHASFGGGVNVTLGLPIVRTSVDHGTALELAGTGKADPGSLLAAVDLACEVVVACDGGSSRVSVSLDG